MCKYLAFHPRLIVWILWLVSQCIFVHVFYNLGWKVQFGEMDVLMMRSHSVNSLFATLGMVSNGEVTSIFIFTIYLKVSFLRIYIISSHTNFCYKENEDLPYGCLCFGTHLCRYWSAIYICAYFFRQHDVPAYKTFQFNSRCVWFFDIRIFFPYGELKFFRSIPFYYINFPNSL